MMDLTGKKFLLLGGNAISCEIVKAVKNSGAFVGVTDYNPPELSPAKRIADIHFMISTTDINAVVELIHKEKFDGVFTSFTDLLLPYYAEIAQKAGLPSMGTKEQFEIFIDKEKYNALFRSYEIPVPKTYSIENVDHIENAEIEYPVIVKPTDSSGSRGIKVCYNAKELRDAFNYAMEFSKSKRIIIEQYLTGEEVTAFWYVQEGEPYFTGLANRHVENHQGEGVNPIPVGYTFPSRYTKNYNDKVVPNMKRMLRESGYKNGMLFLQCKIVDGIPHCYDAGARLTGSLEYSIFEKTCGFNPLKMMTAFALTGKSGESIAEKVDPYLQGKLGWNISLGMRPGKIAKILGFEEVKKVSGVEAAYISHQVGDSILENERGLLKQLELRVLGASNSFDEMKNSFEEVKRIFDVLDENGESLLLPKIDIERYKNTIDMSHLNAKNLGGGGTPNR